MPKLQKRTPLSDIGSSANITTLEDGLRYESLPHDTEQPLTAKHDQVTSSGALNSSYSPPATTRVYSEHFSSAARPAMEPDAASRASPPASQSQPPQTQRRSVDLRRLNGTPYEQAKKYTVARDMHAGELPPAYKRQISDSLNPAAVSQAIEKPTRPSSSGQNCGRCGRHPRTSTDTQGPHHDCDKCGKKKSMSTAGPTSPAEPRVVLDAVCHRSATCSACRKCTCEECHCNKSHDCWTFDGDCAPQKALSQVRQTQEANDRTSPTGSS